MLPGADGPLVAPRAAAHAPRCPSGLDGGRREGQRGAHPALRRHLHRRRGQEGQVELPQRRDGRRCPHRRGDNRRCRSHDPLRRAGPKDGRSPHGRGARARA